MDWNLKAKPEHATAKIAVWWHINDCPVPDCYDARRVRPSIEAAFKELGYSGPVSITAYGDQKHTPDHVLQGLTSTGVDVQHSVSERTCSLMFSDMVEWRGRNPPPATMMLITDQLQDAFSFNLVRLQQQNMYNFFLAHTHKSSLLTVLATSAEWLWKNLLGVSETRRHVLQKCSARGESTGYESTANFECRMCDCKFESLADFVNHLSSKDHAVENGEFQSVSPKPELTPDELEEKRMKKKLQRVEERQRQLATGGTKKKRSRKQLTKSEKKKRTKERELRERGQRILAAAETKKREREEKLKMKAETEEDDVEEHEPKKKKSKTL